MNGKALKLHRWWASHYGTMMAFIYLVIAMSPNPPSVLVFLQTLGLFTIASLGIGTFGHLLNDLTDVVQDVRSGAQSLVARRSLFARLVLFLLTLVAAIAPWWWLPTTPAIVALLVCEFVLFALYSVPPFRWKNRGILGPVADALYGYVVPNVVGVLLFAQLGGRLPVWLLAVIAVWAFLFGFVQIVRHQLVDASRDEIDGISTFVTVRGWAAVFGILRKVVVPLEALSFFALLVCMGLFAPVIPLAFALYLFLVLRVWSRHSLGHTARLDRLSPIDQVHLVTDLAIAKFTWRWLPLLSLLDLAFVHPRYWLLVPLHLVLFPDPLVWLWREGLLELRRLFATPPAPAQPDRTGQL